MSISSHLTSNFDFKIVLFNNLIISFNELFDDLKEINLNFSSSNFIVFRSTYENTF